MCDFRVYARAGYAETRDNSMRVQVMGGGRMLRHTHHSYRDTYRRSGWLTRLNLIYLAVVPAFLVGSLVYLFWFYLTT